MSVTVIDAKGMHFQTLNGKIRELLDSGNGDIQIDNCEGQRYIGAGRAGLNLTINGTPGNALGCYLNGERILVNGNAQDATGDTMSGGTMIIHGTSGDATGYGMRGGKMFIRGGVGYRAGIHMKQYRDLFPQIIVGGGTGNFLGEYMAGGILVVLKLNGEKIGRFTGTGMHGGKIFIRGSELPPEIPKQVAVSKATRENLAEIEPLIRDFTGYFGGDADKLLSDEYILLKPDSNNPYTQLYVNN
ncbi:MAG: glutamate synthase [Oscillospiraceae bacterium]|jgi:glutamate synthase domain-containing protein 3|nr:glutamate synthase [Oscillospiraceae bacterium]